MVYQELVTEIEKLPLSEKLSLLETLVRFISRQAVNPTASESSVERVRGLLKPAPGEPLPTDTVLSDDYTEYLLKKYV